MSDSQSEHLLTGVRVLDLAGEPAALTGRILADLGAEVVTVEPPTGDPLRALSTEFVAWGAGKTSVVATGPDDPILDPLLAGADIVIDTPGFPGALEIDPSRAPQSVWVSVTPFGRSGPRASWRGTDLGAMAASANMWATGDPDRAPIRSTGQAAYAHTGPEAAFAALTALWSGRPQLVDVSMQEVVFIANMSGIADFARSGGRGKRSGAQTGRAKEVWRTKDGWVSFGLRGGKARVPSLQMITELVKADGIVCPEMTERDWNEYHQNTVSNEDLRAIEAAIAEYLSRHETGELYEYAVEHNLMLAPANSPREIYGSAQFAARDFFAPVGDIERFPAAFVKVRSVDGQVARAGPTRPAPALGSGSPSWDARPVPTSGTSGRPAWEGLKILEFGSGAAGPIATRYFAENGADVLRVESRSRPDFLRVYALGPNNPHGLEGSPLFDALNVGKRDVTFNLKHPESLKLVKRLILEWADAVEENFAPRAMRGFGLDYDSLAAEKPDLVMVSACLNGQTGPHKDYPGFGGQGSALSGFNWVTGWPDREPIGPSGTITDSLAPRFVAAALAAGLWYRRRTGRGVYLDISQVEAAAFTLSPWLLDYEINGVIGERRGNGSARTVPHGVFPCEGDDRWIAIATWTDDEWARLASIIGVNDPSLATLDARRARVDDVETAIADWTRTRTRDAIASALQAAGIEAVPVEDFGDVHDDAQVASRHHFVPLTHPALGPGLYERNGFRMSDAPGGYHRASPVLGQDNDDVYGNILGLSAQDQEKLAADGAFE